jgi:SAM-dependent methyltransferase
MNKKPRILYVSHCEKACGVFQFGERIGQCLQKSSEFDFRLVNCNGEGDLKDVVKALSPDAVFYNYHPWTMPWVHVGLTESFGVPQVGTIHEVTQSVADRADNSLFHYHIAPDPTLALKNPIVFKTGRLVLPIRNTYPFPSRTTIGSFGFGTNGKGVEALVATVQNTFKEATIRLHIPYARYGDADGASARRIVERCKALVYKPGITLEFSHDFLDEAKLLDFLARNSLNAFLYDRCDDRGISSVIDYALAVQRPIAVRRTSMFRHIWDAVPSICVEEQSMEGIISQGAGPLERFAREWSESNLIWDYERIARKVLSIAAPTLTHPVTSRPTALRRIFGKVRRGLGRIKRRITRSPLVPAPSRVIANWIQRGVAPIDTWDWRRLETYQPVVLDDLQSSKFNRILDNSARLTYRHAISTLFRLLPDLMAKKIPEANVQQAFVFDTVVRLSEKLGPNPRILCVGSFEDTAAWGLKRIGFSIDEIDPVLNFDLDEFVQRPSTAKGSYDIVFSVSVLEHVQNDELFLQQIAGLLKPGGICVLTCDYKDGFVVGDHKPSVDCRLYTQKDFVERLLPKIADCELLDIPEWSCSEPDFHWEGCDYTFASFAFRKN